MREMDVQTHGLLFDTLLKSPHCEPFQGHNQRVLGNFDDAWKHIKLSRDFLCALDHLHPSLAPLSCHCRCSIKRNPQVSIWLLTACRHALKTHGWMDLWVTTYVEVVGVLWPRGPQPAPAVCIGIILFLTSLFGHSECLRCNSSLPLTLCRRRAALIPMAPKPTSDSDRQSCWRRCCRALSWFGIWTATT